MRKYALMTLAMLAMVVALAVMGCGQKAEEAAPPVDQTAPMDTTAMPMDTTAAPADTMAH
jgi:predicted small lipoprotein YifL